MFVLVFSSYLFRGRILHGPCHQGLWKIPSGGGTAGGGHRGCPSQGKTAFIQSDFLVRRQEDYDDGAFPEANWAPPPGEEDEKREFANSLGIFRRGPDVYYAVIPDRKRHSHSHSKNNFNYI